MTDDQNGARDPDDDAVHGSDAARWGGWTWRPPRDGEWYRSCSYCGCIRPEDLATVLVPQGACAVCGETGWEAHFYAQQPGWYESAKRNGELAAFPADEVARVEAMHAPHPYDPGGAYASWADRKYGWPHKFYVENLINREPDRLHVIGSRRHDPDPQRAAEHGMRWMRGSQVPAGTIHHFRDDDELAAHDVTLETRPTLHAKFYTVHLADPRVSADVKETIERCCGLRFTFRDGRVGWEPYPRPA